MKRLLLAALGCGLLLTIAYCLLVGTSWGHQIDDDALFGRTALNGRLIRLDLRLLDHVTNAALLCAAVLLFVLAALRRAIFVGLIAAIGFGCAVIGAEVLKHKLPWRALVPEDGLLNRSFRAGTYPSGHATVGTSLALWLILVAPARWRPWLAVGAGCMSAGFATGVLFTGWHRPSDALGALAWSGLCMTLTAALAVRFRGKAEAGISYPGHALLGSLGFGILVTAATWLTCAVTPEYPFGDLTFFLLTGLIIAAAFSLIAWYAWLLRAVDWRADSFLTPGKPISQV